MAREPLARLECDPSQLATTIEYAALRSGDPEAHDLMFVRVSEDRIETPAAAPDADVRAYCTAHAAMYDDLELLVDGPVDALFDIDQVLGWLDWHGEAGLTSTFAGDPATGVTERLVHETADAEVVIPCETVDTEEVTLSLPDRFADDVLLDSSGEAVPTRVRTDAEVLQRLTAASDLAGTDGEYTIVVADGDLRIEATGADGSRVEATIEASITGPDVRATVGPGFERVVSSLVGPVALQTGPDEPVAVVRSHETFTLRFVVARA